MLSTQHWRLAVSALAATILCSAQASAGPLAMNDPNFPFGSIFQQVVREPAPQAMPEERVTEEPAGVVQERFRRQGADPFVDGAGARVPLAVVRGEVGGGLELRFVLVARRRENDRHVL